MGKYHRKIVFLISMVLATNLTSVGMIQADPPKSGAEAALTIQEQEDPQDRAVRTKTNEGSRPKSGNKTGKNGSTSKITGARTSTLTWPDGAGRFAIIIGVNDYQSEQINDLKAAVNDARLLAKTLAQNAGFEPDHIKLLTTDQGPEGQPTQGTILEKITNFVSGMPRQGLLLFFFAGHGVVNEGKAYLLPSDARMGSAALLKKTAIPLEDIRNEVNNAGIEQVMFILDACRNDPSAGARGNVDNLLSDDFSRGLDFRDAAFFDNKNRGIKAFVTLYATGKGQRAYEDSAKAQGYFTLAIAEALTGQGNNITNQKGEVTLGNLLNYVQHKVAERVKLDTGKDQVPFYDVSEGYRANDLVISARPVDSRSASFVALDIVASGKQALDAGDFTQAADFYTQAIAQDQNRFDGHFGLGLACLKLNRVKDATQSLTKAVALKPESAEAWSNLGLAQMKEGSLSNAISSFEKAVQLNAILAPAINPELATAYFQMGQSQVRDEKFDESIKLFRRAIQVDPNLETRITPELASATFQLGKNLGKKKEYLEAIHHFEAAMKISPALGKPAMAEICGLYLTQAQELGPTPQSLPLLTKALEYDPTLGQAHYLIGRVHLAGGKIEESLASFRKATQLNPNLAEAHLALGTAYRKIGIDDAAVTAFREAIKHQPELAEAHFLLGQTLLSSGQTQAGVAELTTAITIRPDYVEALFELGKTSYQTGQFLSATDAFQKVIALKPEFSSAHYFLGLAFWEDNHPEEAIKSLKRAMNFRDTFALKEAELTNAWFHLGLAHLKLNQKQEVLISLKEALSRRNFLSNEQIIRALVKTGDLYFEADNTAEAMVTYREAVRLKPDLPTELYFQYGLACLQQSQRTSGSAEALEAIDAFGKSVQIPGAVYGMSVANRILGRKVDFERLHKQCRSQAETCHNQGKAQEKLNPQKAIELYELSIRHCGDFDDPIHRLGLLYARQGNTQRAEQLAQKLIELREIGKATEIRRMVGK